MAQIGIIVPRGKAPGLAPGDNIVNPRSFRACIFEMEDPIL